MTERCCSGGCGGCGSGEAEGGCQGGGCGSCCGQSEVILCREELAILLSLGQYAFLPILTKYIDGEPHYVPIKEDISRFAENFSDLIQSLARKRLITIDSDISLCNTEYGVEHLPSMVRCGSLALTVQGQEVLDWVSLSETEPE